MSAVSSRVAPPGISIGASRELNAADAYAASYDELPVDASCELTETDTGDAVRTTTVVTDESGDSFTSPGVTASIDLAAASGPVGVDVRNEFVKELPRTGLDDALALWLTMLVLLGGGGARGGVARRPPG